MPVLENPVRHRPFAVPAGLNRLLLLCRFDFRQRRWSLPTWGIHSDSHFIGSADPAALASAVSKATVDFSDPSQGGPTTSKIANRRISTRRSVHRIFGQAKEPQKEKDKN